MVVRRYMPYFPNLRHMLKHLQSGHRLLSSLAPLLLAHSLSGRFYVHLNRRKSFMGCMPIQTFSKCSAGFPHVTRSVISATTHKARLRYFTVASSASGSLLARRKTQGAVASLFRVHLLRYSTKQSLSVMPETRSRAPLVWIDCEVNQVATFSLLQT